MVKQYVGARYVPKFASPVEWAANTSYEALTIVTFNNASYTSKIPVPPTVGNPANNPQYWALTGNYNAQVEQYRQETENYNAQVEQYRQETENYNAQVEQYRQAAEKVSTDMTTEIQNRKNADTTLQGQITTLQGQITTEITDRETADATLQGNINSEASARQTADNTLRSNINAEASTRVTQDSVLQSQIDQLIAPSGQAPSAAEVQNARIGADGVTYDTLGNAIRGQVTDLKNTLDAFAINIKYDKTNQPQSVVATLAPTKRWICQFVKAGTYVKSFALQIAAQSKDYVSAELWETNNGTTYTRKRHLAPVSVVPMTNQYKLTFPSFTTDKDGFICTYDTSSAGQTRYVASTGNEVLYFDKTAESISVSGMRVLANASVCYKIEAYDPLDVNNTVTVKKDGTGTYTTIIEAMKTEPEGTPIYVYPGIYEQDMNVCLKKRVILIGTDRNQCIIRDTDGRYGHHPLFVSCGYFENLTIESKYISGISQEIGTTTGSYAVHIDNDDDYGVGKQIEFYHCNMFSDFFPAIGCGLRKDLKLIIDDCVLVNNQISGRGAYVGDGTLGALFIHDANGIHGNQYAIVKDTVMKSNYANALCLYQVDREPQNNVVYCDFINNVLYSEIGKYTNTVWLRNDPFNEDTGIFHIRIGYGNSVASLNNNT